MGTPDHCDPAESVPGVHQLLQWICGGVCQNCEPPHGLFAGQQEGRKKGSQKRVPWGPEQQTAFEAIKARLCGNLLLQRVNPDKPFVLRTDASGYAVEASLEQMVDEVRMPTPEDVQQKETVPVVFLSRKLTSSQRNWVPREQETCAIVLALMKWETWIGL